MKIAFVNTCRADYLVIYDPVMYGKEAVKVTLINDRANDYQPISINDNFSRTLILIKAKKSERVYRESVDDDLL